MISFDLMQVGDTGKANALGREIEEFEKTNWEYKFIEKMFSCYAIDFLYLMIVNLELNQGIMQAKQEHFLKSELIQKS